MKTTYLSGNCWLQLNKNFTTCETKDLTPLTKDLTPLIPLPLSDDLYSPFAPYKITLGILVQLITKTSEQLEQEIPDTLWMDFERLVEIQTSYRGILKNRIETAISKLFPTLESGALNRLIEKSLNPKDTVYQRQHAIIANQLIHGKHMPDDLYELSRDLGRIARVFHGVHCKTLQTMIHDKLKRDFLARLEARQIKSPKDLPDFFTDQFDKLASMNPQQISQSWDRARQTFEDRERFRLMPVKLSAGWRV